LLASGPQKQLYALKLGEEENWEEGGGDGEWDDHEARRGWRTRMRKGEERESRRRRGRGGRGDRRRRRGEDGEREDGEREEIGE